MTAAKRVQRCVSVPYRAAHSRVRAQRGVTLIIAMVSLVILTIGAVALVRSSNVSSLMSGNFAFKRDITTQSERAVAAALTSLRTGSLSNPTTREANVLGNNYSGVQLSSNAHGIPNALTDESVYSSAGFTAGDIVDSTSNLKIRYVIDRLCIAGTTAFDPARCVVVSSKGDSSGGDPLLSKLTGGVPVPVYRISVRVTGPRGAQTYTQATVAL
jgi:type IV pilus assembly protein PilX